VRNHWSGEVLEKDLEEVSEGKKDKKLKTVHTYLGLGVWAQLLIRLC